ncbi:Rv3654c family TadE-like protein [Actinocrispum wychmicini]|uniref:Rv3654c family TadE-like protein n=1 Tax=Actinocrispum wychmicini TaxID=1213861 RepID=UPI00104E6492|nr:Rv3654c family TadE-like protein [Actinocrispum wychmicini]
MDDRGFATVWTAWVVAALAGLFALLMGVAAVMVARHRADGAADLSALAAAAYAPWGEEYACGLARWVSERMEVRLVECRITGWVVGVRVVAAVNGLGEVTAQARAGPADS